MSKKNLWNTKRNSHSSGGGHDSSTTHRSSPVSSCCGSSQGRSSPCYELTHVSTLPFEEIVGCDNNLHDENVSITNNANNHNNKSTATAMIKQDQRKMSKHKHDQDVMAQLGLSTG